MAEEQDRSQKTEAPSQRRLEDARGKGQVVASREVSTLMLFTASALLCLSLAPESARAFALAGRVFLAQAHAQPVDGPGLARLLREAFGGFGSSLALPFLAFLAAPVAATLLQNALAWTAEPLRPKLEHVTPLACA